MKMKKIFVSFALCIGMAKAHAVVCVPDTNVVDLNVDITGAVLMSNNASGATQDFNVRITQQIMARCPAGNNAGRSMRSYVTNLPIINTDGQYQFVRINEYISAAMRIRDAVTGLFYPPVQYLQMGFDGNIRNGLPFAVADNDFLIRIRVDQPFIGSIPINSGTLFNVYTTTTRNDPLNTPVYTISYTGRIDAPQSCIVGAGTVLNVDFGSILANEFARTAPGAKPDAVNVETRSISIQCVNIDDTAQLTMRLQADNVSGDTLLSTNPDIGFKVADVNDNILTPNLMTSNAAPFQLQNSMAQVLLKFWPVSLTGQAPEPGPFRANGFLRVDFD